MNYITKVVNKQLFKLSTYVKLFETVHFILNTPKCISFLVVWQKFILEEAF